jgi:hypothetical protein
MLVATTPTVSRGVRMPCWPVVDLTARRVHAEEAIAAVAAAPVRFVPDALLEALQGAWDEPGDLEAPLHLSVAR